MPDFVSQGILGKLPAALSSADQGDRLGLPQSGYPPK